MTQSVKIAFAIAGLALLWILSGVVFPSGDGAQKEAADTPAASEDSVQNPAAVREEIVSKLRIETVQPEAVAQTLSLYGKTEANRMVALKAETQGQIIAIPHREGQAIRKGGVIARIKQEDRPEKLAQAKALLEQRKIEHKAAVRLEKQGFRTEIGLAEAKTRLQDARAQLKRIELDLAHTAIRSPFHAVVERINVEVGDYVGVNVFGAEGAIANLVDLDPLVISAEVPQNQIASVKEGLVAEVKLSGYDETVEGKVRYVSRVANAQTRTFTLEISVPNKNLQIPAGISAEMQVPASEVQAYFITPSILSLDDAGKVGVKTIDTMNKVRFAPIAVVKESAKGVWVTLEGGEAEAQRIITSGQAYVSDGQWLGEAGEE